jgi:hypothetical protein
VRKAGDEGERPVTGGSNIMEPVASLINVTEGGEISGSVFPLDNLQGKNYGLF